MQINQNQKLNQILDDEIDLNKILEVFKRNIKFISFSTFVLTICSIIYSLLAKPVYKGSFEIVVENRGNKNTFENSIFSEFENIGLIDSQSFSSLKSQ